MRKHFSEFYKPTTKEIKELWKKSIFVFDANVLLDLYRFSTVTSELLLEILEKLKSKNQLWIPHQVGFEFHKHRLEIIDMELEEYDRLSLYFSKEISEQAKQAFYKNCNSHPIISSDEYLKMIEKVGIRISKMISLLKKQHPNLTEEDPILERVTKLFEGLVGDPYNKERLEQIFKEGRERYLIHIPPGYSDSKKPEPQCFGDLVFWFQIIDKAKASNKSVILVTRDTKVDWWNFLRGGEKGGARKELIREIKDKAGVNFHIYEIKNFISFAAKELDIEVSSESKKEIKVFTVDQRVISNIGIAEGNNMGIVAEPSGLIASYIEEEPLVSQSIIEEKASKQIK